MKSILETNKALAGQIAQVAEVAGYLWERGWAERNGGNISVNVTEFMPADAAGMPAIAPAVKLPMRVEGLAGHYFYVTGTGRRMRYVAREPMANGSIVQIDAAGESYRIVADRPIAPTSELPSHFSMHNYMRTVKGRDTKVVCHTHPTDLIALTHNKRFLDSKELSLMLWSMIPETRIIVPHGIGIIPYEIPGTMELAAATIKQLEHHDVVMWEKHGCLAVGDDVIETFDAIDTLSKSAQIYITAKMCGFEPEGMTRSQLDGLCEPFNIPAVF